MGVIRTIKDIDIESRTLLVRVDFNVPIGDDGKVDSREDFRIKAAIPTISYLLNKNCKIILICHLGRPNGKIVENLRLDPVAERLEELLNKKVVKLDDCIGEKIKKKILEAKQKDIILLENLRFYKEEEENNKEFAKKLASLADIYVDDAFGNAHRKHASMVAITEFLPSVAGLLLEKEVKILSNTIDKPKRPFICVIGGIKTETKISLVSKFLDISDRVLIGSGLAATFFAAQEIKIGKSKVENDLKSLSLELLEKYRDKLLLPEDVIIGDLEKGNCLARNVDIKNIPGNCSMLDIGPKTIEKFSNILRTAKTVIWNGPLGFSEKKDFEKGTKEIGETIAGSKAFSIVGGGDTVNNLLKFGLFDKMSFVSTGGGAMLEFLENKELPAIKVLEK